MIKWLRKKLNRFCKKRIKNDDYYSGYEWAVSYITEGKLNELEGLTYDPHDPFDQGTLDAIKDAR